MRTDGAPGPLPSDAEPRSTGSAADPWLGAVVGGEYRLVERLGVGAMGTVYRARHALLERDFAVKVLHRDLAESAEVRRRFRVEVTSLTSFGHRNAVALRHCGEDAGALFLVMDLAPGRTLEALLAEAKPLEPRRAVRIAVEVLEALDEAHAAGIVHRDVKPANVMIESLADPRGVATDRVRVLDFGLARLRDPSPGPDGADVLASSVRRVVGTVAYMAPEQLLGDAVDARADLFAVGVWLHEALTGVRPFAGATPADVAAAVVAGVRRPWSRDDIARLPPRLRDVLDRTLARSPDDRPASAGQLAEALRDACADTGDISGDVAWAGPPSHRSRLRTPHRGKVALAVALLAALAVGVLAVVRGGAVPRSKTSRDAGALRARGEAALDAARPADALAAFTEALRASPDDAAALLGRAEARIAMHDFAALHDLDAAERLLGDAPAPAVLRARFVLEVEGDAARAVDLLSRTLWHHADAVPVREARARAALMAGDLRTAESDATILARGAPHSTVAATTLARVAGNRAARDGDVDLAASAVGRAEAAAAAEPRSAEASMALAYAHQNLAVAARSHGDTARVHAGFDRARRQAAHAIALAIGDPAPARQGLAVPRLRLARAGICFAADDDAAALEELDAALALAPRDALLLKTRGFALQRVGRFADAEADFARLHDATRTAEAAFYLGFCAQRAGEVAADRGDAATASRQFERAREVYEQGLTRDPTAADLRTYRGEVLFRRGRLLPPGPDREREVAAGREALDVVLAGDPADTEARLRRAEVALFERDDVRALDDARRAAQEAKIPTSRHHAVHAEAALRLARRRGDDAAAFAAEAAEAAGRALASPRADEAEALALRAEASAALAGATSDPDRRTEALGAARRDVAALEALAAARAGGADAARLRAYAALAQGIVFAATGDPQAALAATRTAIEARAAAHAAGAWALDGAWYARLADACDVAGDVAAAEAARARAASLR